MQLEDQSFPLQEGEEDNCVWPHSTHSTWIALSFGVVDFCRYKLTNSKKKKREKIEKIPRFQNSDAR